MWAIMRILDKVQPGLQPLANSSGLIQEGSDAPGYPELVADAIKEVEGVDDPIGHLAPKPPLSSVNNPREPTDVERQAFGDDIVPGAPYADPCTDPEPERILEYTIAVMKPGNPTVSSTTTSGTTTLRVWRTFSIGSGSKLLTVPCRKMSTLTTRNCSEKAN